MNSIRIYFLDFREHDRGAGGAVVPGRIVPWKQEHASLSKIFGDREVRVGTENELTSEERITFLVHGFNVTRAWGRISLSRLAKNLPSIHDQAIVVVCWPGDSSAWTTRHLCYVWRTRDAMDCAHEFERFCMRCIRTSTVLSFVSHSLGGKVVMETVDRIKGIYSIGQVCLLAAALDDDVLSDSDKYRAGTKASKRVAILASRADAVLALFYDPGESPLRVITPSLKISNAIGYHGPTKSRKFLFRTEDIPQNVRHEQISVFKGVGHRHYLPSGKPADAGKNLTGKPKSAAAYVNKIVGGSEATYQ